MAGQHGGGQLTGLKSVFDELGRRLGLGDLSFEPTEPFSLEIDAVGAVTFETAQNGDELLVSLSWPLEPYDQVTPVKALEACSLERTPEFPFQAGLFNDKALLMVRRGAADLSAPMIEEIILRLVKIRQSL
jgi:type III secretion system chaperone SycN